MKINKYVLASLVCTALVPMSVCAEDTVVTSPTDETIQLTANKTSSYTVTLPKIVDISTNETKFNVKVKGDINSNETITVTMNDTHLSETASTESKHEDVPVSVTFGDGKSFAYKAADIKDENIKQATLTHDTLPAGTWSGSLTVNIAVN